MSSVSPATACLSAANANITAAHVTHEAVDQLGGIGTVLEGLISSDSYQQKIKRSILVGTFDSQSDNGGVTALQNAGQLQYAAHMKTDRGCKAGHSLARKFEPIEMAFETPIAYGHRIFQPAGQACSGSAEVLLIDVAGIERRRLNGFKSKLWNAFGLDSSRYEHVWDYEQWIRLAEPAYYALNALLSDEELPCTVFAHEFMGMPTALKCKLDGGPSFKTIFHAHECATARQLVENNPGHDCRFYAALHHPQATGEHEQSIEQLFGQQDHFERHSLIKLSHKLDAVLAVGDETATEMRRLTPQMQEENAERNFVHLAYNGLPRFEVSLAKKLACREQLQDYVEQTTGTRPDVLITHVTRPVISKGIWRDTQLLAALEPHFAQAGIKAAYILLTSSSAVRTPEQVEYMAQNYNWPIEHRAGAPDLIGPEQGLHTMLEQFNQTHHQTRAILVNQFGWSTQRVGPKIPEGMDIAAFRIATDVELGMATYEPFGISPLEPLAAGAICVISQVCGCAGLVQQVANELDDGQLPNNVIIADYAYQGQHMPLHETLGITGEQRDPIERAVHKKLADSLIHRIPSTQQERRALLTKGQQLIEHMSWDAAFERGIQPVLNQWVKPNTNQA